MLNLFFICVAIICKHVLTCRYPAEYASRKKSLDKSPIWQKSNSELRQICKAKQNDKICRPETAQREIKDHMVDTRKQGVAQNSTYKIV